MTATQSLIYRLKPEATYRAVSKVIQRENALWGKVESLDDFYRLEQAINSAQEAFFRLVEVDAN